MELIKNGDLWVNKALIRKCGMLATALFSELHTKQSATTKEDWIIYNFDDFGGNYGYSQKQQALAIKKLIEVGLLNKKIIGKRVALQIVQSSPLLKQLELEYEHDMLKEKEEF